MDDHATEHAGEVGHADIRTYLVVAAVLTVVTAVEVGTYFVPWFQANFWILFGFLTVLSVAKFVLVVGFYMHLRYEALMYRRVFVFPLIVAVAMTVVVVVLTWTKFA